MASLATKIRCLSEAREAIESFAVRNPSQQHFRGLLLAMVGYVEANYCRPGKENESELDRWWYAIDAYRRLLESPRLAARGGRKLARRMLALPWERLERPAVLRRLLGPEAGKPLPPVRRGRSRAA